MKDRYSFLNVLTEFLLSRSDGNQLTIDLATNSNLLFPASLRTLGSLYDLVCLVERTTFVTDRGMLECVFLMIIFLANEDTLR
jgi:hypothetical protein